MKLPGAIIAAAALLSAADVTLGEPLTLKEPVSLATLLAKPAGYVGKKVRVKVEDGDIVFLKDSAGKTAVY